jgi:hypothetical protein
VVLDQLLFGVQKPSLAVALLSKFVLEVERGGHPRVRHVVSCHLGQGLDYGLQIEVFALVDGGVEDVLWVQNSWLLGLEDLLSFVGVLIVLISIVVDSLCVLFVRICILGLDRESLVVLFVLELELDSLVPVLQVGPFEDSSEGVVDQILASSLVVVEKDELEVFFGIIEVLSIETLDIDVSHIVVLHVLETTLEPVLHGTEVRVVVHVLLDLLLEIEDLGWVRL